MKTTRATRPTRATTPHWAHLLATCVLSFSAGTALAATAAAPAAASPAAEAPAACPLKDPAAPKAPQININTASALDLRCGLDGDISAETANKIVSNRPYKKVDDLLDMKLVNGSMFKNIQSRVTVSASGSADKPAAKPK